MSVPFTGSFPSIQPGTVTLAQLRASARQHANQSIKNAPDVTFGDPYANSFITTPELNGYANNSYNELYDLMVKSYESYYFVAPPYTFTTLGTQEMYPLPKDHYKLISCSWVPQIGNTQRVVLKPFNVQERSAFGYSAYPIAGQTIELLYVPIPVLIADQGTITLAGVNAGDTLTINGVTFACVNAGPGTTQFVKGATDTITATNLASVINSQQFANAVVGYLQAISTGPVVSIILTQPAVLTWSTENGSVSTYPTMALSPNAATGPLGDQITFSNTMTSYTQWSEYVVIDMAIKIINKYGKDPTAFMLQKEALLKRIQGSTVNRDAGTPKQATITMRRSIGGWGGSPGGYGFSGQTPMGLGNFRYAEFGSNLWLKSGW